MNYEIGSIADLISGLSTPNRSRVICKPLTPRKRPPQDVFTPEESPLRKIKPPRIAFTPQSDRRNKNPNVINEFNSPKSEPRKCQPKLLSNIENQILSDCDINDFKNKRSKVNKKNKKSKYSVVNESEIIERKTVNMDEKNNDPQDSIVNNEEYVTSKNNKPKNKKNKKNKIEITGKLEDKININGKLVENIERLAENENKGENNKRHKTKSKNENKNHKKYKSKTKNIDKKEETKDIFNDSVERLPENNMKSKKRNKSKEENLNNDEETKENIPENNKEKKKLKRKICDTNDNEIKKKKVRFENVAEQDVKNNKMNTDESSEKDCLDEDYETDFQKSAKRRIELKMKRDLKFEEDEINRTIFVGNIPISILKTKYKKKIKAIFGKYGNIESIRFRNIPIKDFNTKPKVAFIEKQFHPDRSTIISYIKFNDPSSVQKALVENNALFEGNHLRVDMCSSGKQTEGDSRKTLFLGNLPFKVEEENIRKLFEICGNIKSIRIVRDRKTQIGKGFGFVNFEKADGVELALQMNDDNLKIGGKTIRIKRYNLHYIKDSNVVQNSSPKVKQKLESNKTFSAKKRDEYGNKVRKRNTSEKKVKEVKKDSSTNGEIKESKKSKVQSENKVNNDSNYQGLIAKKKKKKKVLKTSRGVLKKKRISKILLKK